LMIEKLQGPVSSSGIGKESDLLVNTAFRQRPFAP